MTPQRPSLTIAETSEAVRAARSTPSSARTQQVLVRWRLDARTAASIANLPDADRQPLLGDAWLDARFTLIDHASAEDFRVVLVVDGHESIVYLSQGVTHAVIDARANSMHVDLFGSDGRRLLALSYGSCFRSSYAQTPLLEEIGMPPGRYETATIQVGEPTRRDAPE